MHVKVIHIIVKNCMCDPKQTRVIDGRLDHKETDSTVKHYSLGCGLKDANTRSSAHVHIVA